MPQAAALLRSAPRVRDTIALLVRKAEQSVLNNRLIEAGTILIQ
jgi:hypothetical protein